MVKESSQAIKQMEESYADCGRANRERFLLVIILGFILLLLYILGSYTDIKNNISKPKDKDNTLRVIIESDYNDLLSQSNSVFSIALAILVSGVAITAPLFMSMWQSSADGLYTTLKDIYNDPEIDTDDKNVLVNALRNNIRMLTDDSEIVKKIFGGILYLTCFILLISIGLLIIPDAYCSSPLIIGHILIFIAILILITNLSLIIKFQHTGPIRHNIEIRNQYINKILAISNNKKNNSCDTVIQDKKTTL